jgi:AAA domain (dynein-related subfamily)
VRPAKLQTFLEGSIRAKRRVLVKGKPGIGKSDIVGGAAKAVGAELVLMHPSISDPTDYKGMPALTASGSEAHFLPFGDLARLCKTRKPTVAFLDDIGQAAPAVQAALMQLILARSVNGTGISPEVVFIGATNDTSHMAGVAGMIEPLKSRWDTIVELEVSVDDWSNWALDAGLPAELVAFIRFRPALLSDFKPTKEIRNSPCPRTWASVGGWLKDGVKDLEVFTGAVGEGAATEFYSFLDLYASLPSLDQIILDPVNAPVPAKPAALFAVSTGLARKATPANLERVTRYLGRIPKEFEVLSMRDALRLDKKITCCPAFVAWAAKNAEVLS